MCRVIKIMFFSHSKYLKIMLFCPNQTRLSLPFPYKLVAPGKFACIRVGL